MQDGLPQVHLNEGRLLGRFELPPADMQHIHYQGRVVMVIVADVPQVLIKDTKDGDTQALWKFTAVDAAIVRDPGMVTHLADTLYLDGTEEVTHALQGTTPSFPELPEHILNPKHLVGEYDDEGAFLGFREEEEEITLEELRDFHKEHPGTVERMAQEEELPGTNFVSVDLDGNRTDAEDIHTELVTTISSPIKTKDPMLERFLQEDLASSNGR